MTPESTVVRSYAVANAELVEAFGRWLIAKNYSSHTRKRYLLAARAFATYLASDSIAAADRRSVQAFLVARDRSLASYQEVRIALLSFYRFLTFARIVRSSPLQFIRRPRLRHRLPRCLTEQDAERLIACADSPRDRALLELLYASGLRLSEVAHLQMRDLNLDSGTLMVRCGKGSKDRLAMVGSRAVEALRAYLGKRHSGPVFLGSRGRQIGGGHVRQAVKAAARCAGLAGVHPHTLRHTFATVLLNRGTDIRYVQELLGHAKVSTTQIYTHVAIADLAKVHAQCHPKGDSHVENR